MASDPTLSSPVDLLPGEVEIEEMLDALGENDWSAAAMRHMIRVDEGRAGGDDTVYHCRFCVYGRRSLAAVEKHVFAQHAKCHPFTCAYCQHGVFQVREHTYAPFMIVVINYIFKFN